MKSIVLLAFALAVLPQARADSHWTTNGVHKGVLTLSAEPGAVAALDSPDVPGGHNYLGKFTLTYSLSTILGEPVHDFNFSWDWHKSDLIVARRPGRTITTTDLGRHPALSRAFSSLKPLSITLTTRINFYGTNGEQIGFGFKNVNPGLVEQAGTQEMLHLPGSPRWSDFFTCDFPDNPSRDELSRRNRELFQKAARVVLGDPKVSAIEWPEDALMRIADEFLRLEPPAPQPVRAVATSPNPFEQATRKNSGEPAAQENYTGRFRGQGIDLRLLAEAGKWKGTLLFQARNYNVEAEPKSNGLEGRFTDGDQFWPFSVLSSGDKLIFTTGSFTTTLHRQTLPKLEGGWRSPRLLITFESAAPKPSGHIQFNGQEYSFVAEERAGDLEGAFKAGDKSFPFRIANETRGLVFNTAAYAELLTSI
ncbi:MAG: hypothetical protein HOP33_22495, partial [Verrucomicrobia bacterium]|nr:hypothetical protein [Verrucomicrobiota bacterium]